MRLRELILPAAVQETPAKEQGEVEVETQLERIGGGFGRDDLKARRFCKSFEAAPPTRLNPTRRLVIDRKRWNGLMGFFMVELGFEGKWF